MCYIYAHAGFEITVAGGVADTMVANGRVLTVSDKAEMSQTNVKVIITQLQCVASPKLLLFTAPGTIAKDKEFLGK